MDKWRAEYRDKHREPTREMELQVVKLKESMKWKILCQFSCFNKQVIIVGVFTENLKWILYLFFELLTLKFGHG